MSRAGFGNVAVQVWAAGGVVFLFAEAAWRLGGRGIAAVRGGLTTFEWIALAVITAVFVYGEGVRALQRRWVPSVLARVERLPSESFLPWGAAGPLYAMSLVGRSPASVLRAWAGVTAIILAVLIVSRFPDPWRGIVDAGVAAALVWGAITLLHGAVRTIRSGGTGS